MAALVCTRSFDDVKLFLFPRRTRLPWPCNAQLLTDMLGNSDLPLIVMRIGRLPFLLPVLVLQMGYYVNRFGRENYGVTS